MRVPHSSPAARNRQENLGRLLYKRRLFFQSKHQISVALRLRGQRSKLPSSCTESRQPCVGVLLNAIKSPCNPAKVCCGHWTIPCTSKRISPSENGICLLPGRIMGSPPWRVGEEASRKSCRPTAGQRSKVPSGFFRWQCAPQSGFFLTCLFDCGVLNSSVCL